jgi:predicted methyltransferase MtxX (methanogen marker protein 4)
VLWMDRVGAVISGDTLVDFGRGFEINESLREGVTREQVVE